MDLVAYLDESRKPVRDPATGKVAGGGEHYIIAAADALVALSDWDGYVFEKAHPVDFRRRSEHAIRAAILKEAFPTLEGKADVGRIILESRAMLTDTAGTIDAKDLDVLRGVHTSGRVSGELKVGHASKAEAILTIADVIAGARGDFICGADRSVYPRLAHRIRGAVHRVSV